MLFKLQFEQPQDIAFIHYTFLIKILLSVLKLLEYWIAKQPSEKMFNFEAGTEPAIA